MSISPWLVRRGYLVPRAENAWTIDCTASSTVWDYTRWLFGAISRVLYFLANALRIETGSLYRISRGSMATSLQNKTQFSHLPSTSVNLLVERP